MTARVAGRYAVPKRYTQAQFARALWAIASAEFAIKRRDTQLPLLLAFCAGLCLLLIPPADASYTVLTFGGLKPDMSASTHVIAAGVVLGLLIFPLFLLD